MQRTLMQLLAGMDGFENRGDVKIIAATNRIDILDKALSGREDLTGSLRSRYRMKRQAFHPESTQG